MWLRPLRVCEFSLATRQPKGKSFFLELLRQPRLQLPALPHAADHRPESITDRYPVSQSGDRGTEGGRREARQDSAHMGMHQPNGQHSVHTRTARPPARTPIHTHYPYSSRPGETVWRKNHSRGERTTGVSPTCKRWHTHKRLGGRGAAWSLDRSALLTHTHKRRSHSVLSTHPTRVPPPSNGHRRPT